jgi:hypothetical protein
MWKRGITFRQESLSVKRSVEAMFRPEEQTFV